MSSYKFEKSYLYENYEDGGRDNRRIRFKKNRSKKSLSSITSDSTSVSSYMRGGKKYNYSNAYEYVPRSNYFIKNLSDASSLTSDRSIMFHRNINRNYSNSVDESFNPLDEYTSRCICYDSCEMTDGYRTQIDPRQYGIKTPLKDSHFIKRVLPYKYHYILYKSKFLPKVPCLACAAAEYENIDFNQEVDESFTEYPNLSLENVSMREIEDNESMFLEELPFEGGANSYSNPDRKQTLFSRIGSTIKEGASNAASSIKKSIFGDGLAIDDQPGSASQSRLSGITGAGASLRALSRSSTRNNTMNMLDNKSVISLSRANSRSPSRRTTLPVLDNGSVSMVNKSLSRPSSRSPTRTMSSTVRRNVGSNDELSTNNRRRSGSLSGLAAIGGGIKDFVKRLSSKSISRNNSLNALENSNELSRSERNRISAERALSRASSKAASRVGSIAPSRAASVAPSRAASISGSKSASIAPSRAASVAASKAGSIAPSRSASIASKAGSRSGSIVPARTESEEAIRSASIAASRAASLAASGFQPKSVLKPALPLEGSERMKLVNIGKSQLNIDDKSPLYIENNGSLEAIGDGERQSSIFSLNASIPGITTVNNKLIQTSISVANPTDTNIVPFNSKSTDLQSKSGNSLSRRSLRSSSSKSLKLEDSAIPNALSSVSMSSVSDRKLKELSDRKSRSSKSRGGMSLASPDSSHSGTQSIKSLHTDSEAPDSDPRRSTVKFGKRKSKLSAISDQDKYSLEDDRSYKAIENFKPGLNKSLSPSIFAFKEILDKPISNAIENKPSLNRFKSMPAEISPDSTASSLIKTMPARLPSFKGKPLGSMKNDLKSSPLTSPKPISTMPSQNFQNFKTNSEPRESIKLRRNSSNVKPLPKKNSSIHANEPVAKPPTISKQNTISTEKRAVPDVGGAYCSSLTSDCHYMVVGTDLGYLLIWDLVGHNTNSKFSYEFWDEAAETPTAGVLAHGGKITSIDTKSMPLVTGTSECMIITLGEDLMIKLWILINNRIRLLTVDEFDLNKPVSVLLGRGLSMLNDVMVGYQDGFIELWNSSAISCLETLVPSGIPLSTKPKPNDKSTSFRTKIKRSTHTYENLTCLSLSPTGSFFAVGGDTGMVSLYSLDREINLLNQFPCRNHRGKYSSGMPVSGMDWSEDGSQLCVTTLDNRIRTFFVKKGVGLEFSEKFKGFTLTYNNEYARFAGTNNDLLVCLSRDMFGSIKIVVWNRTITDSMDLPQTGVRYPTNSKCKQFLLDEPVAPKFELCQMGRWGHLQETVGEIVPLSKVSGNFCLKLKSFFDGSITPFVQDDQVNDHTNNLLCILSTGSEPLKSVVISPINLIR